MFTPFRLLRGGLTFVLAATAAWSPLALAIDRVPVQTVICYPSPRVLHWSYSSSGNSTDGVPDHQGYLSIEFAPHLNPATGLITGTTVNHPVEGLSWDADFRNVISTAGPGQLAVTCASRYRHGLHVNSRNCRLEGRIIPNGSCPELCNGAPSYLFDGELLISR
jgi:hypothetical protein